MSNGLSGPISDATALVQAALGGGKTANPPGLQRLLELIAQAMDAYACVLWEVAPGSNLDVQSPDGRLYVLASHVAGGIRCASHDLPLARSTTGRVVLDRKPRILSNEAQMEEAKIDPFLAQSWSLLSVPVEFHDGGSGALNVYRKRGRWFEQGDINRLRDAAQLLPALYRAIRDHIGSSLISEVNEVLHNAETRSAGKLLTKELKKNVLRAVCGKVSQTFHCREVSVFLFDCRELSLFLVGKSEEPIRFELMASTLNESFRRPFYLADERDGLTGWVLKCGKPVWIFDLQFYERDLDWIQRRYPGLKWRNYLEIESVTRELLVLGPQDPLPPLSALAMPIEIAGKVVGAIRCSIAEGPYYFSTRDFKLLGLIASQIAHCWSTWLGRREKDDANRSWENLATTIKSLNEFVQQELTRPEPSEERVYSEAARRVEEIILGAELNSVRLVDPKTRELFFAAVEGTRLLRDPLTGTRFRSLRVTFDPDLKDLGQGTLALEAIQKRRTFLVRDVKNEPRYKEIVPDVRRLIFAPIWAESQDFGVLTIRGFNDYPFAKNAEQMADLLARQLGLYRQLLTTIKRLTSERKQQIQTWSDVSHQLKNPVQQAKLRADLLVDETGGTNSPYQAVRGLCRKAQHVVSSLNLLADLAKGVAPELQPTYLGHVEIVKLLIQASQDSELMIPPRWNIQYRVVRETFTPPAPAPLLKLDQSLLEQAINALFDNAAKYSFKNTKVEISGEYEPGFFTISVKNVGLTLRGDEVKLCLLREWRSVRARKVTSEGSGIGLWVVDHIMKAHGGKVVIVPTAADLSTVVRLKFPTSLSVKDGLA